MKSERPAFDLFFPFPFFLSCPTILSLGLRHSFHTVPPSSTTQNNYQALLHQIMVDIGGHDGEGQRSEGGGPRTWWSSQLILEACSLAVATFYIPWPRFSFVCPNETLSCSQRNRGLAMAGLGGQSTMRRRAVLRQGRICAILLGLGKELMRLNVL